MMVAMVVNLGMVLWGFYLLKLGNERCTFLVISHVYLKSSQQQHEGSVVIGEPASLSF